VLGNAKAAAPATVEEMSKNAFFSVVDGISLKDISLHQAIVFIRE
jgi:hypothetical protein